jgi:hypothetical protein
MSESQEAKTGPITPEEVAEWENALTPEHKAELRRQQLLQVAINKAQPTPEPDWSRLDDGEFLKERMRRYGF